MLRKSKMKRRNTEPSLAGSDPTIDRRRVIGMVDKDNERLEKLLIAENE